MADKEQAKEAKVIEMKPEKQEGNEKQVQENTEVKQEPEVNMFEYGKLMVNCGKCNAVYSLDDGIKNGIQLPALYAVEGSKFTLACKECGNTMSLYFEEGSERVTTKEEESADELQEDNKA